MYFDFCFFIFFIFLNLVLTHLIFFLFWIFLWICGIRNFQFGPQCFGFKFLFLKPLSNVHSFLISLLYPYSIIFIFLQFHHPGLLIFFKKILFIDFFPDFIFHHLDSWRLMVNIFFVFFIWCGAVNFFSFFKIHLQHLIIVFLRYRKIGLARSEM